MQSFIITQRQRRKAAGSVNTSTGSRPPTEAYAVRKIAQRGRISSIQAALIAEILGLSQENCDE